MPQALLKIQGRVQGVFYRSYAQEEAQALGLTGYIQNLPDDSVEALIQGPRAQIEMFIKWCREGSPSAKVEDIKIQWQKPKKELKEFYIR